MRTVVLPLRKKGQIDTPRDEVERGISALTAEVRDRSLLAITGIDVGMREGLCEVGLKLPDRKPKDHELLLPRYARKLSTDLLEQARAAAGSNPYTTKSLDTQVSMKCSALAQDLNVLLLSDSRVILKKLNFFEICLGKEKSLVALINISFPEELAERIDSWRLEMESKHHLLVRHIRFEHTLSTAVQMRQRAEKSGNLIVHLSPQDLLQSISVRERVPARSSLEDHTRLPVASIDYHGARAFEDAHMGVKLPGQDGSLYLESYYPLRPLGERSMKRGQELVALAIGRESLQDGNYDESYVRNVIVSPQLNLSFEEFDRRREDGAINAGTLASLDLIALAGRRLHNRRLHAGVPVKFESSFEGAVSCTELNLDAYRVFARYMAHNGAAVLGRNFQEIPEDLIEEVYQNLPVLRSQSRSTLSVSMGVALVMLRDLGKHELFDRLLCSLSSPAPFMVVDRDSWSEEHVARAKASSLDGHLNQEQYNRLVNGEPHVADEVFRAAREILNKRYSDRHLQTLKRITNPELVRLVAKLGKIVPVVVASLNPLIVNANTLGVQGYIHITGGRLMIPLRVGQSLALRFIGIHGQSGQVAFRFPDEES